MKKYFYVIIVGVLTSFFSNVVAQDEEVSAYGYVYSEELKVAYFTPLQFALKDDCLDDYDHYLPNLWDDYVNDEIVRTGVNYMLCGYSGTVYGWDDPETIRNDYNETIESFKKDGYIVRKVSFHYDQKPCD